MKQKVFFATSLLAIALTAMFFARDKIANEQKLAADLAASINSKNTSSSDGAAASSSTLTLVDVLRQLQDQIQSLNDRTLRLDSEIEVMNLRKIFTRTLKRGDSGSDVGKLQELLTRFPEFYPPDTDPSSTITDFYGSLTKSAITQFQTQTDLKETGVFDTATRETFYESLAELASEETTSTEFVPIDPSSIAGLPNATDTVTVQSTLEDLQSQVSQLAQDSTTTQANVADLTNKVSQLTAELGSAQATITELQNQLAMSSPQPPPPPPAPPPPIAISNVQATNINQTSSTVTWTTNVPATSEVDYSKNSALPADQTTIVNNINMVTSHTMVLNNLANATKYYYRAVSKDATNATTSSTIQSFTTLH